MKKMLLVALSFLIWGGFSTNSAHAKCPDSAKTLSNPIYLIMPTPCQRDLALKAAEGINFIIKGAKGESFIRKGNHWEATVNSKGQRTTIVVYKQLSEQEVRNVEKIRSDIGKGDGKVTDTEQTKKGLVNVAFTSPSAKMGNFIAAANQGEFGKVELLNATTIIVSPNSPFDKKQEPVEVANLPKPIADALSRSGYKKVPLPTGLFMANQFKTGNAFMEKVFKLAGLGKNVTSFVSLNLGNYTKLLKGKAGLSLSILLDKNNGIARLMELTQVFKTPKKGRPMISISAGGGKGGISKLALGIAYKAPYLVMGKGPIKTALAFKYNLASQKATGALKVALGKATNPTIIPNLIKLDGVAIEDMEVELEMSSAGIPTPKEPNPAPEVGVGIEFGKFTLTNVKKSFEPVRFKLAMGPTGPTGGLIEFKSNDTLYLSAIADLARMAINANPRSKIVPSAWKGKNVFNLLQLDKLPQIGIRKPHLFLATPGQDDSNHLADAFEIAGAGVRVKGEIIAFGQRLTYTDLGLDVVNGLNVLSYVKPFEAGIFKVKGAELAIHASVKAIPYFKMHGGAAIAGTTIGELDLMFGKKGIRVNIDQGCVPYMLKVDLETSGWTKITKGGIRASDCANLLGKEIAKLATKVGKSITKSPAFKSSAKAYKDTSNWVNKAAADTEKWAKKAGCDIENFFTGGKCNKRKANKAKKARRKAEKAAARYRRLANPANCYGGWYWHHGYRQCIPGGDYRMLFNAFDGAKNGRCLTIRGAKNKNGSAMEIWDCVGQWNQMFRFVKWNPKDKKSKEYRIVNALGRCVGFNPKLSKGAPIVLWKCDKGLGQKWRYVGGKWVGHKKLCMRLGGINKRGTKIIADDCNKDNQMKNLKQEIAKLKKINADESKKRDSLKKSRSKAMQKTKRLPKFVQKQHTSNVKRQFDPKIKKSETTIRKNDARITDLQKKLTKASGAKDKTPPVEWVNMRPSPAPEKAYQAVYRIPSGVIFRQGGSGHCLDNSGSLLPRKRPHLWKCKKSNSNQPYRIGVVDGQYFVLANKRSKMCLDVYRASKRHGARVIQYPCHYGRNQQWIAVSLGDKKTDKNTFKGYFQIRNRNSNKCLSAVNYEWRWELPPYAKKELSRMRGHQKKQCEELLKKTQKRGGSSLSMPFQWEYQQKRCPKPTSSMKVVASSKRRKLRFAQVTCNPQNRHQLFSIVK